MISVIIPTRDRWDDLSRCLEGLAEQDSPSLLAQVIVVDDYSHASPRPLVQRLATARDLPLLFLSGAPGRGAAAARAYGAGRATGRILGFLDDDCVPSTDWLLYVAAAFDHPDISAVTGRILPLDGDRLFSRARQLRYDLRRRQCLECPSPVAFLAGGNSAILKGDFDEIGGFDPAFVMMHDRELACRMKSYNFICKYVDNIVVRHRNYKGFPSLLRDSFRSARYRLLLESHHDVPRWTLGQQLQPFSTLLSVSRADPTLRWPAVAAGFTESIHVLGRRWYRFAHALSRLRARPLAGKADGATLIVD